MQSLLIKSLKEGPKTASELADIVCSSSADVASKMARIIKTNRASKTVVKSERRKPYNLYYIAEI